jgi:hypothetical protein
MSFDLGPNRTLGGTLTFYATTTRFDTGNATDADAVPTYRVYKEETAAPILTGSMALLDAANTIGLYSEQITLSAANGFENGKDYAIYIQATVNGVTGTIVYTFRVGTGAAAGAIEFTYTVTNSQTGVPIEGVEVWFATDSGFANIVFSGTTDTFGILRDDNGNKPFLDAGTYHIRLNKAGFIFQDDSEVVS